MSPLTSEIDETKLSDTDSQKSLMFKQQKKRNQKKDMLLKLNRITIAQKIRRKKIMKKMKDSNVSSSASTGCGLFVSVFIVVFLFILLKVNFILLL